MLGNLPTKTLNAFILVAEELQSEANTTVLVKKNKQIFKTVFNNYRVQPMVECAARCR